MSATIDSTNELTLTGRIIAERTAKSGAKIITVASKNGEDVILHITCPKDMDVPEHRARVAVKAQIVPHLTEDRGNGKKLEIEWRAVSIERRKTLTEEKFGVKGKFYSFPSCSVCFTGKISKIKEETDWVRYSIILDSNGANSIPITASMKKIDRMPAINDGDHVGIVGSLATPMKMIDGKKVCFENIMVDDIAVISA